MCLNQPFGQIRVNIFVLVTDTDIYTDRGDVCRLGSGLDSNLVLRWMWAVVFPYLIAGLPSLRCVLSLCHHRFQPWTPLSTLFILVPLTNN